MKRRTVLLLVCTLLLLFLVAARVFYVSQEPKLKAKDVALQIASEQVQLATVTDFYWFNTQKTYYSLAGVTNEGQNVYVIVSPETNAVTILQQEAVVNEQEARSITKQAKDTDLILEARLGMLEEEPVWEVNYRMTNGRIGYYYISARTGQWLKDIENI